MPKITVGFSRPKNNKFPIFSWIIRLVEWTTYSHVYIRWHSDKFDRDLVYQASGTMVNFMEGSRFDNHAETLYSYDIEVSDEIRTKVITKAVDLAGAPYGLKQAFGILLVKICRGFGRDIRNPFADGKSTWICSEVVADLLKEMGMDVGVKLDNVTPRDIKEHLDNVSIAA